MTTIAVKNPVITIGVGDAEKMSDEWMEAIATRDALAQACEILLGVVDPGKEGHLPERVEILADLLRTAANDGYLRVDLSAASIDLRTTGKWVRRP